MKNFLRKLIGVTDDHEALKAIVRMIMLHIDKEEVQHTGNLVYKFKDNFEVTNRLDKELRRLISQ